MFITLKRLAGQRLKEILMKKLFSNFFLSFLILTFCLPAFAQTTFPDDITVKGNAYFERTVTQTGVQTFLSPNNYSIATTITAGTTQTQAGATLLTAEFNNVTTVGTAGDGVRLPDAVVGAKITIKNSGANALAIYPFASDSIDALAANLPIRIQPGSVIQFNAKTSGIWESNSDVSFTLNAPTSAKGQLEIKAADSAGNTVTTIVNASQAAARTYTIPDAGASASFAMTQGAQTLSGAQTFAGGVKDTVLSFVSNSNLATIGATTSPVIYITRVPKDCTLIGAYITVGTTVAQSGSDYWTINLKNVTNSNTDLLAQADSNTTKTTTGTAITAGTARTLVLHGTVGNLNLTAGDVISFIATDASGSGADLVQPMLVLVFKDR
jgi:hypothetical protein